MRKRDTAMLIGGTLTGMGIVMNGLAFEFIRENFFRRSRNKIVKAGKIDSVDEMHLDYLKRKGKKWIYSQKREPMEIMSRDGFVLKGEYIHNPDNESGDTPIKLVILSHGYGGTGYEDLLIFADFYGKEGYDILLLDQRGHGKSEGTVITFGAKEQEDIIRWTNACIDKIGYNCEIILHGWSMGAASVYLAAANGLLPKQVKGVVYDCGYSVAEAEFFHVAQKITHLPKTLLYYIIQFMKPLCVLICGFDMYDSSPLFAAKNMKLPILFVHGIADSQVPAWMGKSLYKATDKTPYRDLMLVEGADHTYSYLRAKAEYEERILKLMKACMNK